MLTMFRIGRLNFGYVYDKHSECQMVLAVNYLVSISKLLNTKGWLMTNYLSLRLCEFYI